MRFDDASQALVELAASRRNAIHNSEAADIDISTQRLRRAEKRGVVKLLHPKVWALTALPDSPRQALRAATVTLHGSAASHESAAWLHGWLERPPPRHHVWLPRNSRTGVDGVATHRASRVDPSQDIVVVDHVRTLNKAATLTLLGATVHSIVVERCLDEFLRTESEAWLHRTLQRLWTPHGRGPRSLVAILEDPRRLAGVTKSWMERVTAKLVSLSWLPPFELQHEVTVDERRFRIDIACPELLLGVEAHGRRFHWGVGKEDADNVRDLVLGTVGWKLMYVTHSQLLDPDEFVRLFAATARCRAAQLGLVVPPR